MILKLKKVIQVLCLNFVLCSDIYIGTNFFFMNKIKSIIREEIGRFIINENINNLSRYANTINGYLNQMANIDSLQPQVKQVTMNFMKYCIQIIHAIKRCVQANSLNESLSNWGINVPPELGGNFWNDAVRGYYKTKNFLNRGRNGMYKGKTSNGINQNTLPSVKLSELLRNLPSWENQCIRYQLNTKIGNNIINNIIQNLYQLNAEYTSMVQATQQQNQNAQGTNP